MMTIAGVPLLISLPFLYLGVTHALVIGEEKIQFESFWSLKETEYSWEEDVQGVVIDYSISDKNGYYKISDNQTHKLFELLLNK